MAKLTTTRRKALKRSQFGLPEKVGKAGKNEAGRGAYPVDTKDRARNAKARAAQQVKRGNLTPAEKRKIDAKANRVLKRGAK